MNRDPLSACDEAPTGTCKPTTKEDHEQHGGSICFVCATSTCFSLPAIISFRKQVIGGTVSSIRRLNDKRSHSSRICKVGTISTMQIVHDVEQHGQKLKLGSTACKSHIQCGE